MRQYRLLSVVMPIYNEAVTVQESVKRVLDTPWLDGFPALFTLIKYRLLPRSTKR